ncbi:MAG: hypothetical protein GXO10_03380 [Crenarchaeota archaeon]|nr:hypothetical protein [Thermoproteota archaeon]
MSKQDKYLGFYRAKVIDNNDTEYYGRVKVYVPELMTLLDDSEGIWAFPANVPLGGIDPDNKGTYYQGSTYIPLVGTWVWVFFEGGNPSRAYYFGGIQLKQMEIVAENRQGSDPTAKYVLYKTRNGRVIILSDDESDARVEITGKKRGLEDDELKSVYTIKDNQTTILIDEREGKEKVLISDYKENYICLHTEKNELHVETKSDIIIQSAENIFIQADSKIQIKASDDLKMYSDSNITLEASKNITLQADKIQLMAKSEYDLMSQKIQVMSLGLINLTSTEMFSIRALQGDLALDGQSVEINDGASQVAQVKITPILPAIVKKPTGDRDS